MLNTQFIPAQDKSTRRLMITLHGLGDSSAGYSWLPQAMQLPWLNYLLVDAPDAYYGGYSWYDIEEPAQGVQRSRELLFKLLEELDGKGFASSDIIFSGFSQGCLMSIEIGARYPQRLAGIVGISGYVHEAENLVKHLSAMALQQRFLITHGTQDTLLPIAKVRGQMAVLRQAGLQIDWHEFAKGHTIAGETEMAVIRQFIQGCYA